MEEIWQRIEEIWQRIEDWLEENFPEILQDLLPGATPEHVQSVEEVLGVDFPDDFRISYFIHDGQNGYPSPLIGDWQLLPLDSIVRDWQVLKQLFDSGEFDVDIDIKTKGPVQKKWWHPKWIGFAANNSGDYYCLDFIPENGGKVGQIIVFWHVDNRREVIASSFKEFLENVADDFDQGFYRVEQDEDGYDYLARVENSQF